MYLTALSRLGNKNYEKQFEKGVVTFDLVKVALKPVTTVKSHKFKVLGTRNLFQSIESSNYREVDIRIYNTKNDYYQFLPI